MFKANVFIAVVLLLCLGAASLPAKESSRREKKSPSELPIPGAAHLLPGQPETIQALPFFDDFESGAPGWTADSLFILIENPQNYAVLNPAINPTLVILPDQGNLPPAFSGAHAWWFGQTETGTFIGANWDSITQTPLNGGTSFEPQSGSLISPAIDLSGVTQARLEFKTWWEIEGVDGDAFDLMNVEISTDNGTTFDPLGFGNINPLNDLDGEPWKSYSSGGLGQPGVWLDHLFDLTPYVGNTVYLRFRFDTVDDLYNGFRGWFIDNVSVTDAAMPAPVITSIDPSTVSPFEHFVITGQNFVNGAVIEVGGIPAQAAIFSATRAFVEAPFLASGQYDVKLTNPDGQFDLVSNGLTIANTPPPSIFGINPDSALVGSSVAVTITGEDFQAGAAVEIGGFPLANLSVVDPFTITGDSPSNLPVGIYNVRVINPDGQVDQLVLAFTVYSTTAIEPVGGTLPNEYELAQNFPNPFNPATHIRFSVPRAGHVRLTVHNILGQAVAVLVNETLPAGNYLADFQSGNLSSGVYFYRLEAGGFQQTRKMLLTR